MQLSTSAVGVIAIVAVMISAMTESEHGATELGINHASRKRGPHGEPANLTELEAHAKNDTMARVFSSTTSSIVVEKSSTQSLASLKRLADNRDQLQTSVRKVIVGDVRPARHLKNDVERQAARNDGTQPPLSFREHAIVTSYDPLESIAASSAFDDNETKASTETSASWRGLTEVSESGEMFTRSAQLAKDEVDRGPDSEVHVSPMFGATSAATERDPYAGSAKSQVAKAKKVQSSQTWNELGSGKISGSMYPKRKELGDKIVQPNITSALGKYAPFFEDGDQPQNITARIGTTVKLNCRIGMLTNRTVTWHYHGADDIRLLTVGRLVFSLDQRINLLFQYPTNWGLQIQYASPRDSGLYECQVATFPPLIKKFFVLITAPILTIMDDSGRIISGERHLKAGSALRLKCEVKDIHNESVLWTRGDETLTEDNISENRTTDILEAREVQVVVSTLLVERATPKHAGNYSCVVPEKAKISIAVHVLNGELPAAVHDVNGVSKSVLNLWLIHLTVSYVFSR